MKYKKNGRKGFSKLEKQRILQNSLYKIIIFSNQISNYILFYIEY